MTHFGRGLLRWFIVSVAFFFSAAIGAAADFQYRISDAVAPFFDVQKPIRHFSSIPYDQLDLPKYPYVDTDQLAESKVRFLRYLETLREAGYDAVTLDDVSHMVTLDALRVYPPESPIFLRNSAYKAYFRDLIALAKQRGFRVFVTSDMPFYTREIKKWVGEIEAQNPRLLTLQKAALTEMFESYDIDGVILRIGEGGKAYNLESGYQSAIVYTTPSEVHDLLIGILPIFEKYDKKCIFRTWTIGLGKVGDIVWNPDTYTQVFSGITSAHLIASIKQTPGDFFAYNTPNLTIGTGSISQIVEIENRREYEGGGDFVNFMGFEYEALFQKLRKTPNVLGVWAWNQQGGWGFGKHVVGNFGFNFWNDLNLHVTGKLLQNETNISALVSHFLDGYPFTPEQKMVLHRIIFDSRSLILHGWYIRSYAEKTIVLGKLTLPPLLWIWWDQVTASPPILAQMYLEGNLPESIVDSEGVLTKLQFYIRDWQRVADRSELSKNIGYSLENEYRIFEILRLYKGYVFNYFTYGDGGNTDFLAGKIQEYNQFLLVAGSNFHFDFSEITPMFRERQSIELKRILESFLIALLAMYLAFFLYYRNILIQYIRTKSFLLVSIGLLFILSGISVLVGPHDFFWYFIRMGVVISGCLVIYFYFHRRIAVFLGIVPRVSGFEKSVTQILVAIFPLACITEIILLITLFVGDGVFWLILVRLASLKIETLLMGIGGSIFMLILFLIFWMDRYTSSGGISKKQRLYRLFRLNIGFIIFLYFIFLSGVGGMIFLRIGNGLYPSYFTQAGSGIGSVIPDMEWLERWK